ncbi:MAG: hypothetical protein KAQ62_21880 [Cyclobacteriaceae bacterium]|nr:hypothetical protein [Cyclobacteriaceae bacterium]MCK5371232.1 hypothetical protein [Cyclobacteriaceae bacterium]
MKNWRKHVCLNVDVNACIASNAVRQASFDSKNNTPIHLAEYLLPSIIKTENEHRDSIPLADTRSNPELNDQGFFSKNIKIKTSETLENNSGSEVFFQFKKFYHINFRELKIAIDDFGNFNYLNPDF